MLTRLPRFAANLLTTAALTVLVAVTLSIAAAGRAAADPPYCPATDPDCTIQDHDPGHPGGGGGGGNTGGGGGGGPCMADGQYGPVEVPCNDPLLGSYEGGNCWLAPFIGPTTGPPAGAPVPGAWYQRSCISPYGGMQTMVWVADGAVAQVSPEQLALRAMASIRLLGADIQMAPDPAGTGLVGLPVWMWTNVNANTWGPISASASDAGLSVSITARAASIEWSMGDGSTVTCDNPGTPYEARFGKSQSPTCGHVYTAPSRNRPGGVYAVQTTTTWRVAWAGGGASGVITTQRQSQTTVRIGELQVVNQ